MYTLRNPDRNPQSFQSLSYSLLTDCGFFHLHSCVTFNQVFSGQFPDRFLILIPFIVFLDILPPGFRYFKAAVLIVLRFILKLFVTGRACVDLVRYILRWFDFTSAPCAVRVIGRSILCRSCVILVRFSSFVIVGRCAASVILSHVREHLLLDTREHLFLHVTASTAASLQSCQYTVNMKLYSH